VQGCHEIKARHGTSDAHRLVAHDHVLVQCHREPHTSLRIHPLKAVEVAHEIEEAAPGINSTRHGTSDSHGIVAHDHVLVQFRREQSEFPDLLNMHDSFELAEGADEPASFDGSAPVFPSKKHSRVAHARASCCRLECRKANRRCKRRS